MPDPTILHSTGDAPFVPTSTAPQQLLPAVGESDYSTHSLYVFNDSSGTVLYVAVAPTVAACGSSRCPWRPVMPRTSMTLANVRNGPESAVFVKTWLGNNAAVYAYQF